MAVDAGLAGACMGDGAWHLTSCMGGVPVGGWGDCMCILPTWMSGAGLGGWGWVWL